MTKALILGITGQAGRLLAALLRSEGVQVFGTSTKTFDQVQGMSELEGCTVHFNFNLTEEQNRKILLHQLVHGFYDEVFNLASQMYEPKSWEAASHCVLLNAVVPALILDGMRLCTRRDVSFVQAGSGNMYSHSGPPKDLTMVPVPQSPHGMTKRSAFEMVKGYRENLKLLCSTAVLFSMESSYRDDFFFVRKAVKEIARISIEVRRTRFKKKLAPHDIAPAKFGSLNAKRDWGLAREYVLAMRRMSLRNRAGHPKDYIIATGESHSCRELLMRGFAAAGVWWEKGFAHIEFPRTRQFADDIMSADPSEAISDLGWKPSPFKDVITELVLEELKAQGAPWLK